MTAVMEARTTLEVLDAIEADFPVDEWRGGELPAWPVARIGLGHRIALRIIGSRPLSTGERVRHEVAHAGSLPALVWDRLTRLPHEPIDALFLSDGISVVDDADGDRDRHSDPLRDLLDDRGITNALLLPGHRHRRRLRA